MQPIRNSLNAKHLLYAGYFALILLVGVISIWGLRARISSAVVISAQVHNRVVPQAVQHIHGGSVEAIFVSEGDAVASGQLLLRFRSELHQSNLLVQLHRLEELRAEIMRFEAERDQALTLVFNEEPNATSAKITQLRGLQTRLFHARKSGFLQEMRLLSNQISQTSAQVRGLDVQRAATDARIELIKNDLKAAQSLYQKGFSGTARLSDLKGAMEQLKGEQGALDSDKSMLLAKISHLELEKTRLSIKRRENAIQNLKSLQSERFSLVEKVSNARRERTELELRAPVAGIVQGLTVAAPRTIVAPAQTILSIIPLQQDAIVAARVSPSKIDQIYMEQPVTLRFSSLNQTKSLEVPAVVRFISATIVNDQLTNEVYYLVEIEEKNVPPDQRILSTLKVGTPVEAFLTTGESSPLSYLTKPLTDYFKRAFRDT